MAPLRIVIAVIMVLAATALTCAAWFVSWFMMHVIYAGDLTPLYYLPGMFICLCLQAALCGLVAVTWPRQTAGRRWVIGVSIADAGASVLAGVSTVVYWVVHPGGHLVGP